MVKYKYSFLNADLIIFCLKQVMGWSTNEKYFYSYTERFRKEKKKLIKKNKPNSKRNRPKKNRNGKINLLKKNTKQQYEY